MADKFEAQFTAFAKFGDAKADGKTITLSQSDKWLKQANIIDGKMCTTNDTGIAFKKFKTQKLCMADYNKFIDDLASTKKLNADDLRKSLGECGPPGSNTPAGPRLSVKTMNMIMRLTDPNNYTGVHKMRGSGKIPSTVELLSKTATSNERSPTRH